jgi:glucose-1-phosphatase
MFEHRLLSFELGAVKPDHEIFEIATERVGVAPQRVLFLDDNALNVEGALAAGLRAEQARGVEEARSVLARYLPG